MLLAGAAFFKAYLLTYQGNFALCNQSGLKTGHVPPSCSAQFDSLHVGLTPLFGAATRLYGPGTAAAPPLAIPELKDLWRDELAVRWSRDDGAVLLP